MTMDWDGNMLEKNVLTYPLPPFQYLSEQEKQATSGAGGCAKFGTILMLGFSLLIIGIQ